jgi:hypothetical protein
MSFLNLTFPDQRNVKEMVDVQLKQCINMYIGHPEHKITPGTTNISKTMFLVF